MTDDEMKTLKELVLKVWGNEVAGVNNREAIRQLKNMILEFDKLVDIAKA